MEQRHCVSNAIVNTTANRMSPFDPQLQIAELVVIADAVAVVNDFIASERSAQILRHNVAMLKHPFTGTHAHVGVAVTVDKTSWSNRRVIRNPSTTPVVVCGAQSTSVVRSTTTSHGTFVGRSIMTMAYTASRGQSVATRHTTRFSNARRSQIGGPGAVPPEIMQTTPTASNDRSLASFDDAFLHPTKIDNTYDAFERPHQPKGKRG